jgi:hypothetical protein
LGSFFLRNSLFANDSDTMVHGIRRRGLGFLRPRSGCQDFWFRPCLTINLTALHDGKDRYPFPHRFRYSHIGGYELSYFQRLCGNILERSAGATC